MTEEDKELLFKDLCARLPYHVRCKIWVEDGTTEEGPLDLQYNYSDVLQDAFFYNKITLIKPYLRPMSSMTEEERTEYFLLKHRDNDREDNIILLDEATALIDWLNSHHFDYRGLIEKGLALEAPKDIYKIN